MRASILIVVNALAFASIGQSSKHHRMKALDGSPWFVIDAYPETSNEIYDSNGELGDGSFRVCQTEECKSEAQALKAAMDLSIDPCEDFYEYTCGGWANFWESLVTNANLEVSRVEVIQAYIKLRIRDILEKKIDPRDVKPVKDAKAAYRACLNIDDSEVLPSAFKRIYAILEENGGWPMTKAPEKKHHAKYSWQQVASFYARDFGIEAVYSLAVDQDVKTKKTHMLYVDQPSTFLNLSKINLTKKKFTAEMLDYRKDIQRSAALYAQFGGYVADATAFENEASDIVDFERKLVKILTPEDDRYNVERMYNLMTIENLNDEFGPSRALKPHKQINWLKTIEIYFSDLQKEISDKDMVVVMEKQYLKHLINVIEETPPQTIMNFVHWKMVQTFEEQFATWMIEREQYPERWMYCVDNKQLMTDAIAYELYRQSFVSETTRNLTAKMLTEIQKELWHVVSHTKWMDEATKQATKDKLFSMKPFISFPDWYMNETGIMAYYKGLHMSDDQITNTVNYVLWSEKKSRESFRVPVNKDKWPIDKIEINAYYNPEVNSVDITPWELRANSHFNPGMPSYLNYATVGFTLGHEVSHGFDVTGHRYNKDGNEVDWWPRDAVAAYDERAQCYVDQYYNWTVPEISSKKNPVYINGALTQGENMADAVGLEVAYNAFKKYRHPNDSGDKRLPGIENLTPDQLFFISFANTFCTFKDFDALREQVVEDPHTPNHVRVNGAVINSKHFGHIFNCPAGTKMNPTKKCNIWE